MKTSAENKNCENVFRFLAHFVASRHCAWYYLCRFNYYYFFFGFVLHFHLNLFARPFRDECHFCKGQLKSSGSAVVRLLLQVHDIKRSLQNHSAVTREELRQRSEEALIVRKQINGLQAHIVQLQNQVGYLCPETSRRAFSLRSLSPDLS